LDASIRTDINVAEPRQTTAGKSKALFALVLIAQWEGTEKTETLLRGAQRWHERQYTQRWKMGNSH